MIKTALTFLLIYFSLQIASDLNKDNLRDLKPSPKKIPVTFDAHGVKRVDITLNAADFKTNISCFRR